MTRHVYQLEGQQLQVLAVRAGMIARGLTGNPNLLRAAYDATQDALQIEDLVKEYLEQTPVQVDD